MSTLKQKITYALLKEHLPTDLIDELRSATLNDYTNDLRIFGEKIGFTDLTHVIPIYEHLKIKWHPSIYFFAAIRRIIYNLAHNRYNEIVVNKQKFYKHYFGCQIIFPEPPGASVSSVNYHSLILPLYTYIIQNNIMTRTEFHYYRSIIKELSINLPKYMPDYHNINALKLE